jgi:4-hydroxythreonine-4-phosphate dehydrogenase
MEESLQVHAVTMGDPAGIGPEVLVRAVANSRLPADVCPLLIGAIPILRSAANLTGIDLDFCPVPPALTASAKIREFVINAAAGGRRAVLDPCPADVEGVPVCEVTGLAGESAFRCLSAAIDLAQQGSVDAIVTAPLNKEALHLAGHDYPGHTEILARRCGVDSFGMMLHLSEESLAPFRRQLRLQAGGAAAVGGMDNARNNAADGLSIVHVTLHNSVAAVSTMLRQSGVAEGVRLMHQFLSSCGASRRRIAVCALNPHGGENGLFGKEERTIIEPAVIESSRFCEVSGPFPVDTLIRRAVLGEFDGIVAMYHDQGHIPIKLLGFESAVNITLGLPLIRTSPTHGTAFDRAWQADTPADSRGMQEAILMARRLVLDAGVNACWKSG